jgi:hypothetical protein
MEGCMIVLLTKYYSVKEDEMCGTYGEKNVYRVFVGKAEGNTT